MGCLHQGLLICPAPNCLDYHDNILPHFKKYKPQIFFVTRNTNLLNLAREQKKSGNSWLKESFCSKNEVRESSKNCMTSLINDPLLQTEDGALSCGPELSRAIEQARIDPQ